MTKFPVNDPRSLIMMFTLLLLGCVNELEDNDILSSNKKDHQLTGELSSFLNNEAFKIYLYPGEIIPVYDEKNNFLSYS